MTEEPSDHECGWRFFWFSG